jgi:hypothetical protein
LAVAVRRWPTQSDQPAPSWDDLSIGAGPPIGVQLFRAETHQARRGGDRGIREASGPAQGDPPYPAQAERIMQAPAPDLPVEKGRPGPGLIANVVVGNYLDDQPLYRQSAIMAREGIEIERATLADWVGHVAWWVTPLAERIGAHVMAPPVIHTDDTPIADHPAEYCQMIARPLAPAVRAEAVIGRRCSAPLPGPLVPHIGPQSPRPGLAVALGLPRRRARPHGQGPSDQPLG